MRAAAALPGVVDHSRATPRSAGWQGVMALWMQIPGDATTSRVAFPSSPFFDLWQFGARLNDNGSDVPDNISDGVNDSC